MAKSSNLTTEVIENGKSKTSVFKCSSCGGEMVYSIKKRSLLCPYCDNEKEIVESYASKRLFEYATNSNELDDSVKAYFCPNCGGELELDKFEMVKACPFCGATNCVPMDDFKGLQPDSILPFTVDKDSALLHGQKWIKKRIFAPSKLKKDFNVDNFKGIYVPAFSFDTFTQSSYNARIGYKRTRTVQKDGQNVQETYIEWHEVRGQYDEPFEDEIIEATTQLDQKEMKHILPFDMDEALKYKREYVAGFVAERYDTTLNDSFSILKIELEKKIRSHIKEKLDADEIDYINIDTTYSDVKYRYSMLPLWLCRYIYKQKNYRYIVNGRTGKAYGKAPKSPIRVGIFSFFVAAIAIGIIVYVLFQMGILG